MLGHDDVNELEARRAGAFDPLLDKGLPVAAGFVAHGPGDVVLADLARQPVPVDLEQLGGGGFLELHLAGVLAGQANVGQGEHERHELIDLFFGQRQRLGFVQCRRAR